MGIFGKKAEHLHEDEDHPMEPADPPPAAPAAPAPAAEPPRPRFGIEETVKLVRTLPVAQNAELVMTVLRNTLEMMGVRVAEIIKDAERREGELRDRSAVLKAAMVEFEHEIQTRREEVSRVEAELVETTRVKDRLRAAEETANRSGVKVGG